MAPTPHPHFAGFRDFLAARIGNPAGADEILRHTLPDALREAGEPHGETNLALWFRAVLRRALIDHVRTLEPAAAREAAWRAATAAPADSDDDAVRFCVDSVIATLPPCDAALLHLVDLDGASMEAAAATLDISTETANIVLPRARSEFRSQLESFLEDCAASPSLN